MDKKLYPWQLSLWQQLHSRQEFPHALLLHGPQGVGKVRFAERLAQSLLCEAPLPDRQPCDTCASCGWFAQYNHPDYRRVRPEALDEEHESTEAEEDGKKSGQTAKAGKTPSREIKIDQVRALADFMNVSTHRQGRRIVLLQPAEALNAAAANALLKTLEEPAAGTVFILVTHSIDRLMPTIVSRCQKFALPLPAAADALAWLQAQGVDQAQDWLAEQGGAPLAALDFAQAGAAEARDMLLACLSRPGVGAALASAEKLQKTPPPDVTLWLQRWLYDLLSVKFSGRVRYFPGHQKNLEVLAAQIGVPALLQSLKAAHERRAIASHPLAARLFMEDMLLDYAALFAKGMP